MKKLIIILILIILSGIFFKEKIYNFYFSNQSTVKTEFNELVQTTKDQIITSPLVKLETETDQSFLTNSGIIEFTNVERQKSGLLSLRENSKLNMSAQKKAEDMLEKQYFSHESPLGTSISELVEQVNYEYILVGENLALGNFKDDNSLVQAWMDSPGHRENILNKKYQEIGIGLIRGNFEGKQTWLIVQHFGFPASACSQPDKELKEKIEIKKQELQELQIKLDVLEDEINSLNPRSRKYDQKVQEYNDLVKEYNQLHQELSIFLDQYNNQVQTFNACAEA